MISPASPAFRKAPKRLPALFLLALALGAGTAAPAQTLAHAHWAGDGITADPWWRTAVFYQLDPLTFQDSNGDGFGDLAGVTQRLDYLQSLNVDAILLSPLKITLTPGTAPEPESLYGAPSDFDELIQQASRRRIRTILDLPLAAGRPPAEMAGLARFWFSRGIAGLRLTRDAKAPMSAPDVETTAKQLRQVADGFGGQRVILADAELGAASAQLALTPPLAFNEHLSGPDLHRALLDSLAPNHTAPVFFTDFPNHPRSPDRYADPAQSTAIARLLATLLLTSRSAASLYYGQEIGLQPASAAAKPESLPDAAQASFAAVAPTLMPWGGTPGFSTGKPWLPTGNTTATVAAEDPDPKSLLGWYRQLSAMHHNNSALSSGASALLDTNNPDVVGWIRRPASGDPVVVLLNLASHPSQASLTRDLHGGFLRNLIPTEVNGSYISPIQVGSFTLPPYGVYIGEPHLK